MSENKYTPAEVTLLPDPVSLTVLLKQKEVTVGDGLRIQSFFVRNNTGDQSPYVVQVLGQDADLTPGGAYTCIMRERKQTRIADGQVFTEIQVAAAQAG